MTRRTAALLSLLALAVTGAAGVARAQIERLDLATMVARVDDALVGTIREREVVRVDHPLDGDELYFTHLLVEGRSLLTGEAKEVLVTYPGGFVDDEHGVHNSEAPTEDDVRLGNRVVVFYAWSDNLGGGLAGNALYASHGGLYRTVEGRRDAVVLGRGEGYAIDRNVALGGLDRETRRLARERARRRR